MDSIDFEEAVHYPLSGDDAVKTLLIGGGLPGLLWFATGVLSIVGALFAPLALVSLLALPLQLAVGVGWLGYFVQVARSTYEGEATPPTFADWRAIARDGLRSALVYVAYSIPGAVVAAVVVGGLAVGYESLEGLAGTSGVGMVILVILLGSLGGLLYAGVVGYLFPISMLVYADRGSIGSAFSTSRFNSVGLSAAYALPWLGVAGTVVVSWLFVQFTTWFLVGYLLIPFLPVCYFYLGTVAFRVFGQVYAEKVGHEVDVGGDDEEPARPRADWNGMDEDVDFDPSSGP